MSPPLSKQNVKGNKHTFTNTGDIHIVYEATSAEAEDQRNLILLLQRVKDFYVKPNLYNSVYGEALQSLGKEKLPEMVEPPWARILERSNQIDQILPVDKKISEVFDEAGHLLLILGDPGSGKTTTLLELANALIERFEKDHKQPVPVYIRLSTWTDSHQPLIDWLTGEISAKYRIHEWMSHSWLKKNKLYLLLDGLDEVNQNDREACIKAINEFMGAVGLAVCSRYEEYKSLQLKLNLHHAIRLQSLSFEQVNAYLTKAGPRLAALRATLHQDAELQKLAQSPLMLSIMSLAYLDKPVVALVSERHNTIETYHEQIFSAYVEEMFRTRSKGTIYNKEETKFWLSWLAQKMRQHTNGELLIEHLQPSWLSTTAQRCLYIVSSRLIGTVIVVLIGVLLDWFTEGVGWLLSELSIGESPNLKHPMGLLGVEQELWTWVLITGVLGGLTMGIIDLVRLRPDKKTTDGNTSFIKGQIASDFLSTAIIIITCGAVIFLAASWFRLDSRKAIYGGLIYGVSFGIIFWFRGRGQSITNDIRTADKLNWSWSGVRKGIGWGLVGGLIIGMLGGFIISIISGFTVGWELGMLVFLSGGMLGAIVSGLSKISAEKNKILPNQGIRMSLRNTALIWWLYAGLPFMLLFWLYGMLIIKLPRTTLVIAQFFGFVIGLLISISYGGLDVIYHYILRLILRLKGYAPLNYARFLDHAARLIFLRKVGGGYIFIHDKVLEHFANLHSTTEKI